MSNPKPYKACSPYKTINKIRNILEKVGIYLQEESYKHGNFYASSVIIKNDEFGDIDIRTNGKGISLQYSFASAYAEFMERLQNYFIFDDLELCTERTLKLENRSALKRKLERMDLILNFNYDPDEKYLKIEEVIDNHLNILRDLIHIEEKESLSKFIREGLLYSESVCVPFFNYTRNKTEYLPIDIIIQVCGSNGMCAGNNAKEAIIQGISEIFERYATRQLYYQELTPPSVPLSAFEGSRVYEIIKSIEESTGFDIIIKDCSLGMGLPVFGVIVLNKLENKFAFNLGSDPSPYIAVERCLTEIYQNPSGVHFVDVDLQDKFLSNNTSLQQKDIKFLNLLMICKDGSGTWPRFMFKNKFSYKFTGLNVRYGKDNDEDFSYYTDLIHKYKKELYIRDVSFLGFNSYFVFIPGFSEQSVESRHHQLFNELGQIQGTLLNIKQSGEEELRVLLSCLDKLYSYLKFSNLPIHERFLYNDNKDLKDLDIELLITMLAYKLRDYSNAYKYMLKFLEGKTPKSALYFYCIKDFLALLKAGKKIGHTKSELLMAYNEDLVDEVIQDMEDPDSVFSHHELPHCFDCDKCEIVDSCRYFEVLRIHKAIQKIHSENPINQMNIATYLN